LLLPKVLGFLKIKDPVLDFLKIKGFLKIKEPVLDFLKIKVLVLDFLKINDLSSKILESVEKRLIISAI
jgi:hypothetical protein